MSLRIVLSAGPGDVIGTYRHWKSGVDDPSQVAITYSGQFYDTCSALDAEAYVIASCKRRDSLRDGKIKIDYRPLPFKNSGVLGYHLGHAYYGLRLVWSALRYRADVVTVGCFEHWFLLSVLALFGIKVVPSLHCAFWPAGHRPNDPLHRLLFWLNGWFWKHAATATICVSPECERQVREIAGRVKGPILQVRAQYRQEYFNSIQQPVFSQPPFRIMYAGRVERSKGVFDMLKVAERLENEMPRSFVWEICGEGGAMKALKKAVVAKKLENVFTLMGYLDRSRMAEAFGRSHVVVVPTSSKFAEGLNKVAVEGVLAGRPVVTSRLSHALDVIGDAAVEVPPDDIDAYGHAIMMLMKDRDYYEEKCTACKRVQQQFYDRQQAWGTALKSILMSVRNQTQISGIVNDGQHVEEERKADGSEEAELQKSAWN